MRTLRVEETAVIHAPAQAVYAVLADYRQSHPAILPKPYFTDLTVEEGGTGAGTVFRLRMTVYGQKFYYHMDVTEPEPGRVLKETDRHTGMYSTFTVEPQSENVCRVTITSVAPVPDGLAGTIQLLFTPRIMRRIFREQLVLLDQYMAARQVV